MKVLVIDDDYWTRRITVEALVYSGNTTIEAASGSEGLDLALREKPDCILLDFLLSDCEGTKVLESLKSSDVQQPPIIFVTTLLNEHQRRELLELGAAAVFAKPVDLTTLPNVLKQIVGERQVL